MAGAVQAMMLATLTKYRVLGVRFDGGDLMTRGAGFTGGADGKQLTVHGWFRKQGADGVLERIFSTSTAVGGATFRMRLQKNATDGFVLVGIDGAAATNLSIASSNNVFQVASGWVHFIASVDLADVAKRHIYVNDVSDLTVTTYVNSNMDFTVGDVAIGGNADGTSLADMDIAEFALWPGYIDLSVEANRRLFTNNTGVRPRSLGDAITTMGTPLLLFQGPTSSFVNQGSGGAFTVSTGALTNSPTSPSD